MDDFNLRLGAVRLSRLHVNTDASLPTRKQRQEQQERLRSSPSCDEDARGTCCEDNVSPFSTGDNTGIFGGFSGEYFRTSHLWIGKRSPSQEENEIAPGLLSPSATMDSSEVFEVHVDGWGDHVEQICVFTSRAKGASA